MCQSFQSSREEDGRPDEPSLPLLLFVPMGPGGTVSSLSTVRSHVMKGQHQKRRESKKPRSRKGSQNKLLQLRPIQAGPVGPTAATASADSSRTPPPLTAVQYQADLIPYAWFERDGPVLFVNRSRWNFHSSFQVTSSDRKSHNRSLTPRQSHWMPYMRSPDHTMVKGAVLDATVLAWIGKSPECFQFRVETINWIQEQLKDPTRAVSNATLGAIMTFTQWTAGYNNPEEISSHMNAIERIVDLRGGFRSFQTDGSMIAKLTLFDSMVAVLTGKPPRFPMVEYFVSRPITPSTNHRIFSYESPLSTTESLDSIKYHKNQSAIIACLKSMWNLTRDFESPHEARFPVDHTSDPPVPFVEEQRDIFKTPLLTLPILSSCHDLSHDHVLETLQGAAFIYSRCLTNLNVDFPSYLNYEAFRNLNRAFGKCTEDDFWVRYPGVLLWVMLVGTATARGKEEAAFWMFYLARTGSFSKAENFLMEGVTIRRFLVVQRLMREDRTILRHLTHTSR